MMNRKIGWKLLIPLVLLFGILWYNFVFAKTKDQIRELDAQRGDIELQIVSEQARNFKMNQMKEHLEKLKNQAAVTEIAPFDNIQSVMSSLNEILASTEEYDITFIEPMRDAESGLYRRRVKLTFTTGSLDDADQIIRAIYQSPYRCVIDTMSLEAKERQDENDGRLSLAEDGNQGRMEVVYYEIKAE